MKISVIIFLFAKKSRTLKFWLNFENSPIFAELNIENFSNFYFRPKLMIFQISVPFQNTIAIFKEV